MAWYHKLFNISEEDTNIVNEDIDAFKKIEPKQPKEGSTGEGIPADIPIEGFGNVGLTSFNIFYNNYINKSYASEIDRLREYRKMAETSEISDIIEDATNEATQLNSDNKVLNFNILDKKITENDNIRKNIYNEFNTLFDERIDTRNILWDMFHTFMIDGKVYYERIIDEKHPSKGIIGIKKLPTETMDFVSDPKTGRILYFFQYLRTNPKKPSNFEEAKRYHDSGDLILFNPGQVGYINYGVYANTIHQVRGYLEKARVPYNQLKLLETSVVIYRIVRAPERLVFKIDTGNMPRDKSLKFVEKIKQKMIKKQTYNPSNGTLTNEPDVMCIRKNTEIPLLDGRYLTLDQIIDEHNNGKENWVYTINQETLNIEPGKIKHAKITRRNEKLVRVWLDDGNYIDTTYDHKFILRDGSECRADDLKVNQSLMPLYKKQEVVNKNKENQLYEYVYNPGGNIWNPTHKIVSEKIYGEKQKTEVVHHKDYNRFNNNPSNLQIMNSLDHLILHSYCWIHDYEGQCERIKNGTQKWHSIKENKERHKEWVTRTNIEQNKVAAMQKVLNTPEVREKQKEAVRVSKKEWFENEDKKNFSKKKTIKIDDYFVGMVSKMFLEENRPIRNDLIDRVNRNKMLIKYLELLNKDRCPRSNFVFNRNILSKVVDRLGFKDYSDYRLNFAKILNHKVSKIEYLSETDDTGCIEVEGNHNFAVSKNSQPLVFIRNSMLENFYLPQCLRISNTYIDLLDGRSILLDQLIKEHNEGKKHEVYSVDQKTGKIIRGKVKWAGITRKNAEMVRVYLDNDEYVDVTPDHKFVLRDGSECRADELKAYDLLMSKSSMEKIYVSYVEKLLIKEDTGCLTIEDPGENHNFALSVGIFVKNSADGRGSDVTTVGGNSQGFSELEDIYYFSRKLYRALKYPLSRITAGQEKREADIVFGGSQTSEISRDEIKWAKFLERQQSKFAGSFSDMFLIHLQLRGFKSQYDINRNSFSIYLNRPSHYKEQMDQMFLESRFNNYQVMADRQEFSKYYLMKKYLNWSDEEINDNAKCKELDKKKLGLKDEEDEYY